MATTKTGLNIHQPLLPTSSTHAPKQQHIKMRVRASDAMPLLRPNSQRKFKSILKKGALLPTIKEEEPKSSVEEKESSTSQKIDIVTKKIFSPNSSDLDEIEPAKSPFDSRVARAIRFAIDYHDPTNNKVNVDFLDQDNKKKSCSLPNTRDVVAILFEHTKAPLKFTFKAIEKKSESNQVRFVFNSQRDVTIFQMYLIPYFFPKQRFNYSIDKKKFVVTITHNGNLDECEYEDGSTLIYFILNQMSLRIADDEVVKKYKHIATGVQKLP